MIEATKAFEIERLSDHPSVIILSAKNENRLHRVRKYLIDNGIRHVHFYEPDIGNELTALATEPIFEDRRPLFKKYQLIRHSEPDAEVVRYARKYENGSYYCYRSECYDDHNRTWQIDDAYLWNTADDAVWSNSDAVAVPVSVSYREKGGAQ